MRVAEQKKKKSPTIFSLLIFCCFDCPFENEGISVLVNSDERL